MADVVLPGTGETIATDDVGGRQVQLVEPMGISAGDFTPNPFYQRSFTDPWEVDNLRQDSEGNLSTRGAVTTDEGSFRDDFTGSGLTTAISGNITTTNGSPLVSGTNFLANAAIKFGHYLKVDSHSETALARVVRILSDTQLELETNYSGASTTAAGSTQNFAQATGSGGSFAVSSSALTIASGTTTSSTSYIYRNADYPPMIGVWICSLSQRIANQTAYIGFFNTVTAPSQYARFAFDGTANTSVKCQSAFSTAAADIEETTVTLPGAGTTAVAHRYKTEMRQDQCLFWIDEVLVAAHRTHLPDPYTVLNQWAGWVNGGSSPSSTSSLVIDVIGLNNFDVLHQSVITPQPVFGDIAHDGVDSGPPVKIGGQSVAALSTATMTSAGDRTNFVGDIDAAQIVRPDAPLGDMLYERLSDTSGNATNSTVFGATSGAHNVITYIAIYNDSTTNGFIDFLDGSSPGTILLTLPLPAKGGAIFQPSRPLRQPTANNAFRFDVNAALTTVYISTGGYKSKV